MNNKELKDYTDQELTSELARRIDNLSLDANCLIYPLVLVGSQYINWYQAEKQKSQKLTNHE